MKTIAENLQIIKDSVEDIKQAIIDKGGTISGNITTYADAINGLSSGGSDTPKILRFANNTTRVYIDGMTWGEWVDSIYNTSDIYGVFSKYTDTGSIQCTLGEVYEDNGSVRVLTSQLINDSIRYTLIQGSGGSGA